MTYEEFIEKTKEVISKENSSTLDEISFYPKGFTSDDEEEKELIQSFNRQYLGKDDDVLLEDLIAFRKKPVNGITNVFRIAVERIYEDYLKYGFEKAMEPVYSCSNAVIDYSRIQARTTNDFEAVRSTLILRPLSLEIHEKDLKQRNCIYRCVGDIALVLYQVIGEGKILSTGRILQSDIQRWKLPYSTDVLMLEALHNTFHKYPPVVFNYRKGTEMDVLKDEYSVDDIMDDGYGLLTSHGTPNGAMALFYPSVRQKLREVIGCDFIAVPVNILNIAILKPDSPKLNGVLGIARSITPFGEPLSNMAFYITKDSMIPCTVSENKDTVDQNYRFHVNLPEERCNNENLNQSDI